MREQQIAAGSTSLAGEECESLQRRGPLAQEPLLSVIVPVYNEAGTVDHVLRRVLAAPHRKQVIVVDDGSTDATAERLERWEGHPDVLLLAHSKNRGKGAAIRTGLEVAEGQFTIIQDADLEYDPRDYPKLVEPLLSGYADESYEPIGKSGRWPAGSPRWLGQETGHSAFAAGWLGQETGHSARGRGAGRLSIGSGR
ncbi:MAG TPA: glycosyltransferase family 2 protein, partial [Planctomycetaceae bacterium]|nr:glycosyltransferase family 2 protein [Planctomycetaceae bacterium]